MIDCNLSEIIIINNKEKNIWKKLTSVLIAINIILNQAIGKRSQKNKRKFHILGKKCQDFRFADLFGFLPKADPRCVTLSLDNDTEIPFRS